MSEAPPAALSFGAIDDARVDNHQRLIDQTLFVQRAEACGREQERLSAVFGTVSYLCAPIESLAIHFTGRSKPLKPICLLSIDPRCKYSVSGSPIRLAPIVSRDRRPIAQLQRQLVRCLLAKREL
jgi:hypothetical protein